MLLDTETLIWLALAVPFLGTGLVPLVAKFGKAFRAYFAVAMGFLTALMVVLMLPDVWFGRAEGFAYSFNWAPSIGLAFSVYIDPLSVMMAVVAGGIGSLVLLYSTKYMEASAGLSRYYALVLLFIGAMIGLVFVDNLLVLYFFWEVVGLCSYALIGFYNTDPKAAKAGIKALVTTRVGDIAFLIGIFVLSAGAMAALGVGFWQSLSIRFLIGSVNTLMAMAYTPLAIAGFCFILGAVGKSAQVPLHVWLPDAMEAPTTISALIHAATMVNAGVYLMARTLPLFAHVTGWTDALMWIGGITAFLAATMALVEPDLKRVLAYSTVSQLGFMMFAIGLGFAGFAGATFHLFSHAIFKALLFLGAGAVIHAAGTRNMYQMGGLSKEMKVTFATMLIGTLSLAGLIGLGGFWSKDMILAAAWETGNYFPLFVVVVTATLTAAYAFRMLYLVFFGESRREKAAHEAPWQMSAPLLVLMVGTLISVLVVGFLLRAYASFGFHEVQATNLGEFIVETFSSMAVVLSIVAFFVGVLLWLLRKRWAGSWLGAKFVLAAQAGYWFNEFYEGLVLGLREISVRFRRTHTGDLNYNMVGVAIGILVIAIALFVLGGA
ncbi:MAG: NADH-quinone oxidoreductase subunit L [Euryarchaeota archaeon]|nr:NADH-quinone oxidoreductase subunit L [Euryarchaeota archaeon]